MLSWPTRAPRELAEWPSFRDRLMEYRADWAGLTGAGDVDELNPVGDRILVKVSP